MNSTEFKVVTVDNDGTRNYILYKKHYFWFGLFWEWHLLADTDYEDNVTRSIFKIINK